MSNLFASMIRDIRESKEGRIHRVPAMWKLAPDETREDGVYDVNSEGQAYKFVRVSTDVCGRKMVLVRKRAVHCRNPQYIDEHASLKSDRVCISVPQSFCQKCEYYRPAKKNGTRYACCGYARSENPGADTAKEFLCTTLSFWERRNNLE